MLEIIGAIVLIILGLAFMMFSSKKKAPVTDKKEDTPKEAATANS